MKILFICEFFPKLHGPIFSGGVETRCYYTALNLAKDNPITIISRRKKGESSFEKKENLTIIRIGNPVSQTSASIFSLLPRIAFIILAIYKARNVDAEMVEGSNYVSLIPAFIIGKIKGIKKIAWYPDVLLGHWQENFGFILGTIGELCEKLLIRLPWDHYITISQTAKERLLQSGLTEKQVSVIPCGINYPTLQLYQNQWKSIEKNKPVKLVVVSRLVNYKRVNWVIRLAKELNVEWSLTIIGTGPCKNELEKLTKDLGLINKVKFEEKLPLDQLYDCISQAHLLIHPSLIEGFGIVLIESTALGTPWISADIPTAMELKESLECGKVFAHNNFHDLVKVTKEMIENSEGYKQQLALGKKNVSQYDWETLTKNYLGKI